MILNFSQIFKSDTAINWNDYIIKKECYQRFSDSFSLGHSRFPVPTDSENGIYLDESVRSFLLLKESDDLQF